MKKLFSILAVFMMAVVSAKAGESAEYEASEAYANLVEMMGSETYSCVDDGDSFLLFVDEGKIYLTDPTSKTVALSASALTIDGNNYNFSAPEALRFVVEDDEISHIYAIDDDDDSIIFEFTTSVTENDEEAYSTLVSILGTDKYYAKDDDMNAQITYIIYVKEGEITLVSSYLVANATTLSSLSVNGKTYEFSEPETIRFVVEGDNISHIYIIDEDDDSILAEFTKDNSIEIPKVWGISELIEAMNGVTFSGVTKDGVEKIFAKDDAIYAGMNGAKAEISYGATVTDYLNYIYVMTMVDNYNFYVSDGRVVYIETEDYIYTAEGTASTMDNMTAAMGDVKYIDSEGLFFVADEGYIYFCYEAGTVYKWISDDAIVTKVGDDYYCFDEESGMVFIVEMVGGKVAEIHLIEDGFSNILYPASSQSTPISDINIEMPSQDKTIKTVNNGKIVIIKNGVKYDLSGQKL